MKMNRLRNRKSGKGLDLKNNRLLIFTFIDMGNTTAQNKYFEALTMMTNSGQTNNTIDNLLEDMFAEFDHNIIGLNYEMVDELLVIIGKRFQKVNVSRSSREHVWKFEDAINLRHKDVTQKSLQGLGKYGMEKLPSGLLSIYKNKSEDNNPQKNIDLKIKLKWRGDKTQMYHVIRQLKSNNVLVSSYEDIGLFLIQNIDKFDGSELSTVINELQKKKYDKIPHSKRIDLSGLKELNED
jgi:hypothetical protein